jgi:hypothetical protein
MANAPKHTFTPHDVEQMMDGSTRIAPGIWLDNQGDIHFSVPELLQLFGWPNDATHRQLVVETIRGIVAREYPNTPIVESELES